MISIFLISSFAKLELCHNIFVFLSVFLTKYTTFVMSGEVEEADEGEEDPSKKVSYV